MGGILRPSFLLAEDWLLILKCKRRAWIQLHKTMLFSTDSEYLYTAIAFKWSEKLPNSGKYTLSGLKFGRYYSSSLLDDNELYFLNKSSKCSNLSRKFLSNKRQVWKGWNTKVLTMWLNWSVRKSIQLFSKNFRSQNENSIHELINLNTHAYI